MNDDLDSTARAVLDYMRSKPFPVDRWFTDSEMVDALAVNGLRSQDILQGIAQCQAAGLIFKGPRVNDYDEPRWRPDNRTKI